MPALCKKRLIPSKSYENLMHWKLLCWMKGKNHEISTKRLNIRSRVKSFPSVDTDVPSLHTRKNQTRIFLIKVIKAWKIALLGSHTVFRKTKINVIWFFFRSRRNSMCKEKYLKKLLILVGQTTAQQHFSIVKMWVWFFFLTKDFMKLCMGLGYWCLFLKGAS